MFTRLLKSLISPASITRPAAINSEQSMPENISSLRRQDGVAASRQLRGASTRCRGAAAWRYGAFDKQEEPAFFFFRPTSDCGKKVIRKSVSRRWQRLGSQMKSKAESIVGQGLLPVGAKLLSDTKENIKGGPRYSDTHCRMHTHTHTNFMPCYVTVAALCWVTRQMTFFESGFQRSHTWASEQNILCWMPSVSLFFFFPSSALFDKQCHVGIEARKTAHFFSVFLSGDCWHLCEV